MCELFFLLPERGFLRFAAEAFWQTGLLASLTWLFARCLWNRPAIRSWFILLGIFLCLVTPALTWLARQYSIGVLSVAPATTPVVDSESPSLAPDEDHRHEARAEIPGSPATPSAAVSVGEQAEPRQSQSTTILHRAMRKPKWPSPNAAVAYVIALVWSAATTACAVRLGMSTWQVWQLSCRAYDCRHPKILAACREATRRLGLPRAPRVLRSPRVTCPTVSSWGKVAVVFVPMKLQQGTDWLGVFCHELAHVRRWDGWRRVLIECAAIAFPWQPLIWMLRREHHSACEEACDDWAVFAGADPIEYAQTLTLWVRQCPNSLAPGFSGGKGAIRHRIQRLIGVGRRPQPRVGVRWVLSGGLVAALIALGIPLLQPSGEFREPVAVLKVENPSGIRIEQADWSESDTSSGPAESRLTTFGSRRWKHAGRARAVGFDASGNIFISTSEGNGAGRDDTVRFWDLATGNQVDELPHFNRGVALTADRRELLVGQPDGTMRIVDVATRETRRSVSAPVDSRAILAISDRGARMAISGVSQEARKKVTVWNYESGKIVATFSVEGIRAPSGFALSPNGDRLATTGGDELMIWDVDQKQRIGALAVPPGGGAYRAVAFSPDGQSLVAAAYRGKLQVWSTQTLDLLGTFAAPPQVLSIAFDPLGRVMAMVDYQHITLWDWSQHKAIWKTPLARFAVSPNDAVVAFSADSRQLAIGNFHHLVLLDTATGTPVQSENEPVEEYCSMALHPDANHLAIGTTTGTIKIRDMQSQEVVRTWNAHSASVRRLCYCADGTMLVSAGDDRAITLWDPATGKELHHLEQHLTITPYYLGFSPDSQKLVCSSGGHQTNIWNARAGTLIGSLKGERGGLRGPVAFSPDQQTLYTIDSLFNVSLWDPVSQQLKTTLSQKRTSLHDLVLSRDGKMLAAGYFNRLCVWDVDSRTSLIDRAVSQLTALAFAPDGTLITAVDNGQLEFWDARTGQCKRTFDVGKVDGTVQQILVSPAGSQAYTLNANGTISLLTL